MRDAGLYVEMSPWKCHLFRGKCIMSDAMYDVRQEQYPMVIREMIRHENDVTNHRIMWLLVGQGFIANAYVSVRNGSSARIFCSALRAFWFRSLHSVMLYQSYQARGYLLFLGLQTKEGMLQESHLPLMGWPRK